jgi:hypothetical protein
MSICVLLAPTPFGAHYLLRFLHERFFFVSNVVVMGFAAWDLMELLLIKEISHISKIRH